MYIGYLLGRKLSLLVSSFFLHLPSHHYISYKEESVRKTALVSMIIGLWGVLIHTCIDIILTKYNFHTS